MSEGTRRENGRRTCVNLACGTCAVDGWLNFDYAPASSSVKRVNLLGPLPLGAAAADVLYSSHFLEHVPRKRAAAVLAECFRVLKPGGKIRLVLPDLEEMCREYLRLRDAGEHPKADFVVLEMLDQCVRPESGGALGECLERVSRNGPAELADYVADRTGLAPQSARGAARRSRRQRAMAALREPVRLRGRLERLYCRALVALLPPAFREQNVSLADVGERHAWAYDFHTLSALLTEAGFVSVQRLSFDRTGIEDFPLFPLDVTREGKPRKGRESMYVEALRP